MRVVCVLNQLDEKPVVVFSRGFGGETLDASSDTVVHLVGMKRDRDDSARLRLDVRLR